MVEVDEVASMAEEVVSRQEEEASAEDSLEEVELLDNSVFIE